MKKQVSGNDEAAGIIDQGNKKDSPLPFLILQPGAVHGIPIPDFIDVGALIAAHVFIRGEPLPALFQADKAFHRGRGDLADVDMSVRQQGAVDLSGCDAWVFLQQEV